jgi:hypothetical protein
MELPLLIEKFVKLPIGKFNIEDEITDAIRSVRDYTIPTGQFVSRLYLITFFQT